MSDFHQLRLAFDRGLLGICIHHSVSALCSCHRASWAGSTQCNNWREMSSSEPRHPVPPAPPPRTSTAPFCSGLLVSFLASSVLRGQKLQPIGDICPTDMMQMCLCDMGIISLFIHPMKAFKPPDDAPHCYSYTMDIYEQTHGLCVASYRA